MEVTENNSEGRPLVILQELPFISLSLTHSLTLSLSLPPSHTHS